MRAVLLVIPLSLLTACGGVTAVPPGSDAGDDAGADAAKAPFCASFSPKPLFCDDFDASTDLTAWTTSGAANGTLAVQPGDAASAPNAMRASIQPGTASAYATVALSQTGLSHARLAFKVRLDPACFTGTDLNNGLVGLGTAVFGEGAGAYSLSLFAGNGSSLVFEGGGAAADAGPGGQYLPATYIPMGAWARVEMDVDLAGGKKVQTRVNDGNVEESALAYAPDTLGAPLVSVGLNAAVSHPTACVALFDDVVFDGGS